MPAHVLDMAEVGHRLRDIRRRQHLTQTLLAQRAGVDLSGLSELECGRRSSVSLTFLYALAMTLDVSLDYLTARTDTPTADPPYGCTSPAWRPW